MLLALFFASGAAALIYQVLWLKELGLLFGVTAYAAATTLAAFFLGLSAGSLAWGRRAERLRRPLRAYAWLEVGIALAALLYFLLLDAYRWLYPALFAAAGDRPALLLGAKFLLAMGVLFPPAFFMGGTLPVMGQYLIRRAEELGRTATVLYAVNTFGAAAGALAAGFFLPRLLGFRASYLLAIAINLGVAAIAGWWSRVEAAAPAPAAPRTAEAAGSAPAGRIAGWLLWLLAFASGALTLALEVLWTRMFSQVLQNSVYTFAIILTIFLVALALGSVVAHWLCRVGATPGRAVFALLTASGLLVGLTPLAFYRLSGGLQYLGADLGWASYVAAAFGRAALVLLLPGIVIGSVFPYLMKLAEARMSSAGRTIGQLAGVNTLAAILGSLAAGFVMLDLLGLWTSIRAVALAYLALALVALLGIGGGRRRLLAALPAAGIVTLVLVPGWAGLADVRLEPGSGERVAGLWEGAHGTVAVIERDGDLRLKVNNSYLLGTSGSAVNERLQAWLPLALHPRPRSVFFLGMGTGITAGAALAFPVEWVTVCELNADVVEAARTHFGPYTYGLFEDPRVELLAEDGRSFLAGTERRYDLVIADLFLTYKAGVGSLYTLEHFRTIRERLEPGGLFVQWLPLFDLSHREFGIIARTMLEVFPQVTAWRRSASPRYPVLALVGKVDPAPLDAAGLARGLRRLADRGALAADVWIVGIPLAAYVGNLSAASGLFEPFPLSTDDRRPLEYLAPITERDSKGSRTLEVLAWQPLAAFSERLLSEVPPARDPYLAGIAAQRHPEILAGLALYRHETYRRLERAPEAAAELERFRRLVAAAGDPAPETER